MQALKQLSLCTSLSVRAFYYAPHPLIDQAPGNDITSLTMYTTHTRVSDMRIYIYIYSSNPWESNHRDGPTGHKNKKKKSSGRCLSTPLWTNPIFYTVQLNSHTCTVHCSSSARLVDIKALAYIEFHEQYLTILTFNIFTFHALVPFDIDSLALGTTTGG